MSEGGVVGKLASALRDGIAYSRGDIIVWSDSDFSMPPPKISALLAEIAKGPAT